MPRDTDRHDIPDEDRRDMLRNLGFGATAVVTAGLAGCSGDGGTATPTEDDSGDTDAPTEEQGGTPVDGTWNVPTDRTPSEVHWNSYNPSNVAGATRNWVQEYMIGYRQADGTYVPSPVFEDLSVDGTTMTITVDDSVTWHDGDPLTADDVTTQVKMDIFMDQPPADVIESVETVSDTETEITLTTENREVALGAYAGRRFHTKADDFGEFVERFEEAGSDDERDDVRADVSEFEDDANSLGPFRINETTQRRYVGEAHDGHPAYDALEGVDFEATQTTGNQGILQMGITGDINYIGPIVLSADALEQLPDQYQRNPVADLQGQALFWNHENDHVARQSFRKAVAHVLDRETIAENAAGLEYKTPVGTPTGIPGIAQDIPQDWLGDTYDSLSAYETDEDAATTLLEDDGYSQVDGSWEGPDGEEVSLELVYPGGWTDWVNAGQTINSQLQNFGFDTELETVDAPTWEGETLENGEFDITPQWWGGQRPHPFFGFRDVSNGTQQENANIPQSFEVPMPVGDPEGSTEEVDLADLTSQLPQSSGDEADELVAELGWAFNQALPVLPIMEKIGGVWYSTNDWNVPEAGEDWMTVNPPTHLTWPFHVGEVSPELE